MSIPLDVLRRGPVLAVQTGGSADAPVLEQAERLARQRGDGNLTRLVSHGQSLPPPAGEDGLRVRNVRRAGGLAEAAAAQAREDGASWIVAPSTLARPLFRVAPCPLLLWPAGGAPASGPVLVPVDFSRRCAAAARFAGVLGSDVLLMHAFRVSVGWHKLGCGYSEFVSRLQSRCREDMERLLSALKPLAPQSRVVLGGDWASTILTEIRQSQASQVVLASPRRTFAASCVPSVAERVASSSPVPVWILRDDRAEDFLDVVTR
jgi:nucleotide-binding universal stress UspA family protein